MWIVLHIHCTHENVYTSVTHFTTYMNSIEDFCILLWVPLIPKTLYLRHALYRRACTLTLFASVNIQWQERGYEWEWLSLCDAFLTGFWRRCNRSRSDKIALIKISLFFDNYSAFVAMKTVKLRATRGTSLVLYLTREFCRFS